MLGPGERACVTRCASLQALLHCFACHMGPQGTRLCSWLHQPQALNMSSKLVHAGALSGSLAVAICN
ncbi:hypothetical protein BA896_022265 [Janthinobacterium lividum]|uniref:Uncharacterized protein n=1 Tax=Janthinobacterium lividum TaxID=29581 RepID=A0A1E8PND4_9BURK|nr:hypothetical protein BA896_022265 [Janthinobacterium lividum]